MEKKRIIVDYKNITNKLLSLLLETYPNGYEDAIIKFKNAKNEWVSAVPLETEDAKYLVKVSVELDKKVEAFSLMEEDEEDELTTPIIDVPPIAEVDDTDNDADEDEEIRPRKKKRSSEDRFMEAGFDPEDDYDDDEEEDYSDEDEDDEEEDY